MPRGLRLISLVLLGVALAGGGAFAMRRYTATGGASGQPPPAAETDRSFDAPVERERWAERIAKAGPEAAYREFKTAYANANFEAQHAAAHLFGELLYERAGLAGLAACDQAFSFGCYHSFFGRAILARGAEVVRELDEVCLRAYGPLGTGCQHGIGHGLAEYFGSERLADALRACGAATERHPLFGCTSGVFMEYNVPLIAEGDHFSTQARPFDPDDPHAPCPDVPERFRDACYYGLAQWWDAVLGRDYRRLGLLCQPIAEEGHRTSCYLGIGNVAAPSSAYDVASTVAKCGAMPEEAAERICLSGASWSFFAMPEYRALSPLLCKGLDGARQRQCAREADLLGIQP